MQITSLIVCPNKIWSLRRALNYLSMLNNDRMKRFCYAITRRFFKLSGLFYMLSNRLRLTVRFPTGKRTIKNIWNLFKQIFVHLSFSYNTRWSIGTGLWQKPPFLRGLKQVSNKCSESRFLLGITNPFLYAQK